MTIRQRLGEILIQQKLVTQEVIDQALRAQVGGNRRLGHILVRMKVISEDQLADILANQLDTPLCDIDERFSPEARKAIPRYLCRQYGVLPLSIKQNNILALAMANPADEEARNDIEKYTGMVVEPYLARYSDIEREISRRIPLGLQDFFSARSGMRITRIGIAACLVLFVFLGVFTYRYMQQATYGTVSQTGNAIIYKNHDLMVGIDNSGTINLLGRGAFAGGFYSVTFKDAVTLRSFIQGKQTDFSEKQKEWLDWAISRIQSGQGSSAKSR